MIEVTSLDTGKTFVMTSAEFFRTFGRKEGKEILAGHIPNIVAVKLK